MIHQKPRGTEDIYEDINFINWIEKQLYDLSKLYNLKEVRTPTFENKKLYTTSVGLDTDIVSKEMFELKSKSENEYVLKPEGTASVARFIIEKKLYNKENLPLKLFYLQNMYRYERPQKGRMRQFYQFGVEIIGENSSIVDIETITMATDILNNLGIKKYTVLINSLGDLESRNKYKEELLKSLKDVKKCDDCNNRINTNPLRILDCKKEKFNFDKLPKIYDFLSSTDKENLNFIIDNLKNKDIKFKLDNKLVRGLDYYTSIVFEIISDEPNYKDLTLLGGGRYNNLISNLGGENLPAFGFAIGIERIRILLSDYKNNLDFSNNLDLYIITLSKESSVKALSIAHELRKLNIKLDLNYNEKTKIKNQFKLADKLNANNVLIIGEKELEKNIFQLKNMKTKKVFEFKMDELINYFKEEDK